MGEEEKPKDRIEIEDVIRLAPIVKLGEEAIAKISDEEDPIALARYSTLIEAHGMAMNELLSKAAPLINFEITKLLSTSYLKNQMGIRDSLYYAGIQGLKKGIGNFDEEKMGNPNSLNYLIMWFGSYARRELMALEAPMGVSPSRYEKFRKIKAVRKKLASEIDRNPTDEELLIYFHNGGADRKNLKGRKRDSNKAISSNKKITLDLIKEERDFESNRYEITAEDSDIERAAEIKSSYNSSSSLIRAFLVERGFSIYSKPSIAVICNELGFEDLLDKKDLQDLNTRSYNIKLNKWKELFSSMNTEFFQYLSTKSSESLLAKDLYEKISSSERIADEDSFIQLKN